MSKPTAIYPDVERLVVDWLTEELAANGETVTVGVPVPSTWTKTATTSPTPHVQVAVDGVDTSGHPIRAVHTVRVTVWASSTTTAKRLAWLCHAFLCTSVDANVRPVSGPVPGRDPDTRAELATFLVSVAVRSTETYNS